MSNYLISQTSRTASTVAIAGMLASQLLAGYGALAPKEETHDGLLSTPYRTKSVLPSFDQFRSLFGGSLGSNFDQVMESVSNFYTKLLASQEPLGAEFSRVLHENLWDLYER